jgi:hypothetical protein
MCDRQWSLDTEPDVTAFEHKWCGGWAWPLPVGDQPAPWPHGGTFGNDMISSIVIPPNKKAQLFQHGGFAGGKHDMGPGFYPGTPANDWYSSVKIFRTQDWADTVTDCCTKNKSKDQCLGLPYGPNSAGKKCNPIMMKYCSRNPDNANSQICHEWYLENPTFRAQIAEMVCSNPANIEHPKCRDWCKQNPGKCDISAKEYCKKHPKEQFCACMTSPVTKYNPACVDSACISGGYVTASMKTMPCPNIVDCSTQIELEAGGRASVGNVVQNCGATEQGGGGSAPTPSSGNSGSSYMILIMFVFMLIVIIAGFIFFNQKFSALTEIGKK